MMMMMMIVMMIMMTTMMTIWWMNEWLMVGLREYCRWETFSASCPLDEVIVIRSALYGRMRSGRCLMTAQDGGSHVGCKANVIRQTDRLCSGRRTCDVQLPEPSFDVVPTTCPRGLTVYLEVIYECLPGNLRCSYLFLYLVRPSTAAEMPNGCPLCCKGKGCRFV